MQSDAHAPSENAPLSTRQILLRGLRGQCPRCGGGRLFSGYIKQVPYCTRCGEETGCIQADDGPAWLTILVTGHIVAPMLGFFALHEEWPEWMGLVLLLSLAVGLAVLLLPRAKGLFIAAIWMTAQKKGD